MWFVEPRELAPAGTGIFHLVASSDEGGGETGCCAHPHRSPEEAVACPDAQANAERITGMRAPAPRPSADDLARAMFAAYNAQAGGLTWDGKPIPPWENTGPKVQENWRAAAREAFKVLKG